MTLFWAAIISFGLLLVGAVVVFVSLRWFNTDDVTNRLNEFVAEQSTQPKRAYQGIAIQTRELTGSLTARLLLPAIRRVGGFFGRMTPAHQISSLEHQLMIGGNPLNLGAREFYGLRMAATVLGIWLAYSFLRRGIDTLNVLMGVISALICYLLPIVWLRWRMQARQNMIRKGLPDALDMLSVCASAGLGFDQSLQRVSEYWDNPVGVEFGRVINEMEMGLSRREALHNLADRVEVRELSSFVSFILQSEQLGMSITDTLHSQADQMRVERRYRAQEQAQKVPTKMLIPMAFLIFPAIIAVVLGPAVPSLVDLFGNL